jgi:hypothetical protein
MCKLKLRMICETIAMACLAAHGDIEATRQGKVRKAYEADWILNTLERLHSDFYPKPGRQVLDAETGRPRLVEPVTSGFLLKADLLRLYRECGKVLHRGRVKNVFSREVRPVDLQEVAGWCDKVRTLLNHHMIQLVDEGLMFWVIMHSKDDGKVHGFTMQRIEATPPLER